MANNPSYTFQRLTFSAGQQFDALYKIYTEALPASERKTKSELANIVQSKDYIVLLVNDNNDVIGFSILFVSVSECLCLLEYMAIRTEYRNSGQGKALFEYSCDIIEPLAKNLQMLIEVDSDRENSADREMRKKRKLFYRRLGCKSIRGLQYILPQIGRDAPPLVDLMIFSKKMPSRIAKSTLQRWISTLYVSVYNCSKSDVRITTMMQSVDDPIIIE